MLQFTTANKWNVPTKKITEYLWRVISLPYTHRCVWVMEMSYHKSYRGIYLKEVNQDKKKQNRQLPVSVESNGLVQCCFYSSTERYTRVNFLGSFRQPLDWTIFPLSQMETLEAAGSPVFSGIVHQCTDVSLGLDHNAPHHPLKNLKLSWDPFQDQTSLLKREVVKDVCPENIPT